MEDYKQNVFAGQVKGYIRWEFQNEYWEKNYAEFVKNQDEGNLELFEETEEWEIALG